MCEIMSNINKVRSVKVAEIYTHTHTHLNSAKHNINEINLHPKGYPHLLGVLLYEQGEERWDGKMK